jgi:hypothetical protein
MRLRSRLTPLAVALLLAAPACSSSPTDAESVAGVYELRAVNGRAVPIHDLGGALDGSLVLTRDGRATRHIRYGSSGVPDPIPVTEVGTFQVEGSQITFRLLDTEAAPGALPWERSGELRSRTILFRWPAPGAGGGWVEERYERAGR